MSGLDRLIDDVMKCLKCGAPMRSDCSCWEKCSCGCFADTGKPCRNSETARCSTKVKYGRYNPADWNIYANGSGGWYAWNGRTRRRVDLYPIPQGGTWRDVPAAPNGAFSAAVAQFERLIGPYYESR